MGHLALALALALSFGTPAGATLVPGVNARTLSFGGRTRLYDVYVPAGYDGSHPVPLVLDFHSLALNKNWQRTYSGFKEVADTEGFLVAYPLGVGGGGDPGDPELPNPIAPTTPENTIGPSWNNGLCCGEAITDQVDDVGFSKAIVSAISGEANVDLRRVYASGLSAGAGMAQRLACEASDVFAAVAPVAFPNPVQPPVACHPARPIPVIAFAGRSDPLIAYQLMTDSFASWTALDGCGSGAPEQTVTLGPSTSCDTHTTCAGGVEVTLCSLEGCGLDAQGGPVFCPWELQNPYAGQCTFTGIQSSPFTFPCYGHTLYFNQDDVPVARTAWDFLRRFTRPIVDVNGAWQVNTYCGGNQVATAPITLVEDLATGTLPGGGTQSTDDCGIILGHHFVSCMLSGGSDGQIGGLSANEYHAPGPGGFNVMHSVAEVPFDFGLCSAPNPPVARATNTFRQDGTITADPTGRGTRIDATMTLDFHFEDAFGASCFDFAGACGVVLLRNAVGGSNQTVTPLDGVQVTFPEVTSPGTVDVTVLPSATGEIDPAFQLLQPPTYYEVTTNVVAVGDLTICIDYPDADDDGLVDGTSPPLPEADVQLLHREGPVFVDRTSSHDAVANRVCATVASLSPFVLGAGPAPRDDDFDGVLDPTDQCPATPRGTVIDATGCGVAEPCPCDGPPGGGPWPGHGEYVRCVSTRAQAFFQAGLLDRAGRKAAVQSASKSTCGRVDRVRCCLPSAGGTRCRIVGPPRCVTRGGVAAGVGSCLPTPCS